MWLWITTYFNYVLFSFAGGVIQPQRIVNRFMKVLGLRTFSDEQGMSGFGLDAIGQPAVRGHPITNLAPAEMNIFLFQVRANAV